MADIIKYVACFDLLLKQIPSAGNAKISPLDTIIDCFSDKDTPADGVQVVDLGDPAGTGTAQ